MGSPSSRLVVLSTASSLPWCSTRNGNRRSARNTTKSLATALLRSLMPLTYQSSELVSKSASDGDHQSRLVCPVSSKKMMNGTATISPRALSSTLSISLSPATLSSTQTPKPSDQNDGSRRNSQHTRSHSLSTPDLWVTTVSAWVLVLKSLKLSCLSPAAVSLAASSSTRLWMP